MLKEGPASNFSGSSLMFDVGSRDGSRRLHNVELPSLSLGDVDAGLDESE